MEIVPGIHRIVLPLPGFALQRINVYLVRADDGWLLVDCGWNAPEPVRVLNEALRELNIAFQDIRRIVVTHIHPDHFGMVGKLTEQCGCSYSISEIEADLIETRYIDMERLLDTVGDYLRQNGVPEEEVSPLKRASLPVHRFVVPAMPGVRLKGGEAIEAGKFHFQVLRTPGHSPGHICLYDPASKVLIAGDQVLYRQTPNVSLHAQQRGNPLNDFLGSLRMLDRLEVSLVLPGHDEISRDLHGRVRELLEHHDRRNEEILRILDTEAKTAYDIAPRISWVTSIASWQKLPSLDKRFAVLETLAHLEYLTALGEVHKLSFNGKTLYERR